MLIVLMLDISPYLLYLLIILDAKLWLCILETGSSFESRIIQKLMPRDCEMLQSRIAPNPN